MVRIRFHAKNTRWKAAPQPAFSGKQVPTKWSQKIKEALKYSIFMPTATNHRLSLYKNFLSGFRAN